MLELRDIGIAFGGRTVISGQSLSLAPGERVALMGPSGCGKTSLLRVAAGLLKPSEGRVEREGDIACVFQEPRLLPWLTAAGNVNLVLSDRAETLPRAVEALRLFGLGDVCGAYPRELSGGMRQRVSLARALAAGGSLLLLDEPFKELDAELRRRSMELIAARSSAILLATHNEEEAKALDCRILSFNGNKFA